MSIINKKAFTLIEMLVVVLIIGILAAIALPIYMTSLEKSRAFEAFANGKAIYQATQIARLSGISPITVDDLDITFKWENTTDSVCPRSTCFFLTNFSYEFSDDTLVVRRIFKTGASNPLQSYYFYFNGNGITCFARTDQAKKICIALGGKEEASSPGSYKL
jgi:prepilin-type N-terminal cleavage/methylation domain-containing protein